MTTATIETPASMLITCQAAQSVENAPIDEGQWDAFVESVSGWGYQSWDWTSVWMQHYRGNRDCRVQIFRTGEQIVGIMPIVIDEVHVGPVHVRVAKPALADFTPAVTDPCVCPDMASEVLNRLLERLFGADRCDVFTTGPVTESSGAVALYRAAAMSIDGAKVRETDIAPETTFDLPESYDSYLRFLSLDQRAQLDRDEQRLRETHTVEFDAVCDPEAIDDEFEQYLRLYAEQWPRRGRCGHFNDWPGAAEFARAILKLEAARGRARLYRLILDGTVVAYQPAFRFGDRLHLRLPARRTGKEFKRLNLNRVVLNRIIERAINDGVHVIESGRGHSDYKLDLGARETPLKSAVIVRPGLTSRFKAGAFDAWANALHFGYYRVWHERVARILPIQHKAISPEWIRTRL